MEIFFGLVGPVENLQGKGTELVGKDILWRKRHVCRRMDSHQWSSFAQGTREGQNHTRENAWQRSG